MIFYIKVIKKKTADYILFYMITVFYFYILNLCAYCRFISIYNQCSIEIPPNDVTSLRGLIDYVYKITKDKNIEICKNPIYKNPYDGFSLNAKYYVKNDKIDCCIKNVDGKIIQNINKDKFSKGCFIIRLTGIYTNQIGSYIIFHLKEVQLLQPLYDNSIKLKDITFEECLKKLIKKIKSTTK